PVFNPNGGASGNNENHPIFITYFFGKWVVAQSDWQHLDPNVSLNVVEEPCAYVHATTADNVDEAQIDTYLDDSRGSVIWRSTTTPPSSAGPCAPGPTRASSCCRATPSTCWWRSRRRMIALADDLEAARP